jgi:glyceraldehyde 3-phosphate dehydrogenase
VQSGGHDIEVVAFNDLGDVATMAHLLKYDSVLGRLKEDVHVTDDGIAVGGKTIKALAERDPGALPWKALGVDVVLESTGFFTKAADARKHVDEGGAKKVIITAPVRSPICPPRSPGTPASKRSTRLSEPPPTAR